MTNLSIVCKPWALLRFNPASRATERQQFVHCNAVAALHTCKWVCARVCGGGEGRVADLIRHSWPMRHWQVEPTFGSIYTFSIPITMQRTMEPSAGLLSLPPLTVLQILRNLDGPSLVALEQTNSYFSRKEPGSRLPLVEHVARKAVLHRCNGSHADAERFRCVPSRSGDGWGHSGVCASA